MHEQSEQGGASKRVSEQANGRASDPVITSRFLAVLNQSGMSCDPPTPVVTVSMYDCTWVQNSDVVRRRKVPFQHLRGGLLRTTTAWCQGGLYWSKRILCGSRLSKMVMWTMEGNSNELPVDKILIHETQIPTTLGVRGRENAMLTKSNMRSPRP